MKKLSLLLSVALMSSTINCYAYESKAQELYSLIDECERLGINTQYEEIDANIINNYASYITDYENRGLDSSITEFQKTELDRLYEGAKEKLTGYLNGESVPTVVYEYENGDSFSTSGASLINKNGKPYFSTGFGHFNMSSVVGELKSYGYDNIQCELGPQVVITSDRTIDNWNVSIPSDMTAETEVVAESSGNSLHMVVNQPTPVANKYVSVTQMIAVKPDTTYEVGCRIKGTGASNNLYRLSWDHPSKYFAISGDGWNEQIQTVTTGSNEYLLDFMFIFNQSCDLYIDDVFVREVGKEKNYVKNSDFNGDGHDRFDISYTAINNHLYMRKTLVEAEKNGAHVCVLLSPHYFPEIFKAAYPEMYASNGMGFVVDHELAREVIEAYIRDTMETLEDFPAVSSICLTNEPSYNTAAANGYYDDAFRDYLEEIHGTIKNLNSTYGLSDGFLGFGKTSYDSFNDIKMPTSVTNKQLFYDWKNFNDKVFADWHSWMADIVKEYTDKPVHTKLLQYFQTSDWESGRSQLQRGVDAEMFDEFSDITGTDSATYLDSVGGSPMHNMMKWYDYLNSVTDKPIYDSEFHITMDGSELYSEDMKKHTSSALWQGAVHGRDMASVWTWSNTTNITSDTYGHLRMRPESVSAVAKANLDLNRLSYEVTAIANKDADTAVFLSDASRVYENYHINAVTLAYNSAVRAGRKVGFVTDKNITQKLGNYKTLIIPAAEYVKEDAYQAILDFANNGGEIVVIGNKSLSYNEYKQSRSNGDVVSKATVFDVSVDGYHVEGVDISDLLPVLAEKSEIQVVDAATGEFVEDIEVQFAPYKGGYVVNVYNYGAEKDLYIIENGVLCHDFKELISNEYVTDVITVGNMERGLYYLSGEFENEFFGGTSEQKGSLMICSGTATNPYDYAVTAKLTVTAFNEDGSFAGAAEFEKKLPAGARSDFYAEFEVKGTGRTVVKYE